MLARLGVDRLVAAVYEQILSEPTAGVAELAAALGVPETDVHTALDALADLALLRPSREQAGRLLPVSPQAGLRALMRRQEEELARRRAELEASHAAVTRLVADYAEDLPGDRNHGLDQLIGIDAIQGRMEELAHSAVRDTLSLVPGGPVPAEALAACRDLDAELARRGIASQILYQDSVRADPTTMAYAAWMIENRAEIRTAPVLPQRLFVVDHEVALVPLDPSDPGRGAVCVTAPGVLASLIALFEQIWETAAPLDACRPVDAQTGLTGTERELLRMLAGGMTDEAAAKRLGVSLRTVRRRMEDLMARLGASSRFEAGLKAGQRGWL